MKIFKLLLKIQMICKMFLKILKKKNNLEKKCKALTVFDYIIASMISNKKLNQIVIELSIRGRKLNVSIVVIT